MEQTHCFLSGFHISEHINSTDGVMSFAKSKNTVSHLSVGKRLFKEHKSKDKAELIKVDISITYFPPLKLKYNTIFR